MVINWALEGQVIECAAALKRVDAAFIKAIRETEQGGPDIAFGVEPPGAYNYAEQLELTCTTVAHRLAVYPGNPLTRDANGRIIYSDNFIAYFASIWAPVGAANDPTGLNSNWYKNCTAAYAQFLG